MSTTLSPAESLLKKWLWATTCSHHQHSIQWQRDNFVVLKHKGHSEYIGRFNNIAWCETYYRMYDLRNPPDGYGKPYLKQWEGRWSKAKQAEAESLRSKNV